MKIPDTESPIWTAVFSNGSCRYEEIGHEKGPPITLQTAERVARMIAADGYSLIILWPSTYKKGMNREVRWTCF